MLKACLGYLLFQSYPEIAFGPNWLKWPSCTSETAIEWQHVLGGFEFWALFLHKRGANKPKKNRPELISDPINQARV